MHKNNNQTLVGLGVLIIIGIIYFGIYPALNNLKSLNLEVASKTKEASGLTEKINSLKQIQTDMKVKANEMQKLGVAFPGSTKTEEVYFALEALAASSGVSLDNLQPNSTQGGGKGDGDADATVTVSGSFNNVTDFIAKVNKNLRPARLNTLTLASVKASDSNDKISATLNLSFLVVATNIQPATKSGDL